MTQVRKRRQPTPKGRGGRGNTNLLTLVLNTYGDKCHLCHLPGANSKDHLIPWSWTRDDSLANLRPAHISCNSRRGNRALPGYGAEVVIVMGPPASGKTTWVREHAKPGDVVIDFDVIARALGADPDAPEYAHPSHINWIAQGARKAAIERGMRLAARVTVYVIHALPSAKDLDDYRFMRYKLVTIDPGQDIVLRRVEAMRPPQMIRAVQTWYGSYAHMPALAPAPDRDAIEAAPVEERAWW